MDQQLDPQDVKVVKDVFYSLRRAKRIQERGDATLCLRFEIAQPD